MQFLKVFLKYKNRNKIESYTKNYQKRVACSYGYKLVCSYDKFSKLFRSHLLKDAVCNFINRMI